MEGAHRGQDKPRLVLLAVVGAFAIGVGAGAALGWSLSPSRSAPPRPAPTASAHRPVTTTSAKAPTTSGPEPNPSSTTAPSSVASIPVVVCPTTFAAPTAPGTVSIPASVRLQLSPDLAPQIAAYSDDHGIMQVVAPRGWECDASYGADGSGEVVVYAAGEPVPGGQPFSASFVQAVVGHETSACLACAEIQACPLIAQAAADYERDFQSPCPESRPASEASESQPSHTNQSSSSPVITVVRFSDPPGIAGDGNPSGGPWTARGVMTYGTPAQGGSWVETCTLPDVAQPVCDESISTFAIEYGNR